MGNPTTSDRNLINLPVQATYANHSFEVSANQTDTGLWAFEIKGSVASAQAPQSGPFYENRVEALVAGISTALHGMDAIVSQLLAYLDTLAQGQPVDLGENNPLGPIVRDMVEELLASEELDPHSDFAQHLRSGYERSK